jgi:5-methylcytosine-specific restriction endonuclease McrA
MAGISKKDQLYNKRVKTTQRQKGAISNQVRELVYERSNGICERCISQRAMQMAHLIGRKQIDHVTTENDLWHLCVPCHKWLDETVEGIQYKREKVYENEYLS